MKSIEWLTLFCKGNKGGREAEELGLSYGSWNALATLATMAVARVMRQNVMEALLSLDDIYSLYVLEVHL